MEERITMYGGWYTIDSPDDIQPSEGLIEELVQEFNHKIEICCATIYSKCSNGKKNRIKRKVTPKWYFIYRAWLKCKDELE